MDYLESSTVKSGFQKANNLAFCRLNALSSAKGIKAPKLAKPTRKSGLFALWHPDGILLEKGISMRQKCMEHFHSQHPCRSPTAASLCKTAILPFCETALAGREAANPMDGMSN